MCPRALQYETNFPSDHRAHPPSNDLVGTSVLNKWVEGKWILNIYHTPRQPCTAGVEMIGRVHDDQVHRRGTAPLPLLHSPLRNK